MNWSHIARRITRTRGDGGFTLIEVTIALALAVILITGLTITLGNSLRAVRHNRTLQQANELALERVEFARSLAWDNLALAVDVNATDPFLLAPGNRRFKTDELGVPPPYEDFVEDATNGWVDTYRTEVLDETTYEVATYVSDADTDLRRVTVVIDWKVGGAERRHFTSVLISEVSAS